MATGRFDPYLADACFRTKFDYLISDMNTHPVHGLRFLHAMLIERLLSREGKTPADPLSPAAREEITALLQGLTEQWRLSQNGIRAMTRLAESRFNDAEARHLEQALLERAASPHQN